MGFKDTGNEPSLKEFTRDFVIFGFFWRIIKRKNILLALMDPTHNEKAFLQLIQDNKGILFKISNSYCRSKDDREDLMQEIIYQLWKAGGTFDVNRRFSTWMYRIALNVAISFYRKQTRSGIRLALGGELHLMELEDRPDGDEASGERIALLQQCIGELGQFDKALMILYLEEKSYREIADILGITETNVATKISRIKGRLKQLFLKSNELQ
jgi:RNA polymerase sigma factor (sigma-70 family)